jgi:hypothetical protein
VTPARALTPTFAEIRPADAPAFIGAQLASALLSAAAFRALWPTAAPVAAVETA